MNRIVTERQIQCIVEYARKHYPADTPFHDVLVTLARKFETSDLRTLATRIMRQVVVDAKD